MGVKFGMPLQGAKLFCGCPEGVALGYDGIAFQAMASMGRKSYNAAAVTTDQQRLTSVAGAMFLCLLAMSGQPGSTVAGATFSLFVSQCQANGLIHGSRGQRPRY